MKPNKKTAKVNVALEKFSPEASTVLEQTEDNKTSEEINPEVSASEFSDEEPLEQSLNESQESPELETETDEPETITEKVKTFFTN
jgi:hypothetical protein